MIGGFGNTVELAVAGRRLAGRPAPHTQIEERFMSKARVKSDKKQVVTIRLDESTLRKAQILAARCSTSLEDLLALQIELLAGQEEAYERAELQAAILLDQSFHLGGKIRIKRDKIHER
jgi:hypothetical protein